MCITWKLMAALACAAAMDQTNAAIKDFAEAAEYLRTAFSPDFEAIGEVSGLVSFGTATLCVAAAELPLNVRPLWHWTVLWTASTV